MIVNLRNNKVCKVAAITLLVCFLNEFVFPLKVMALSGGPSQPEVESFKPIGANDLVDPFTGDFSYNIPLMDVGGYPINLIYNSNITMDQEASWVGLGWNVNVGAITRNLRGLPDDLNGDLVKQEYNLKDNATYGVEVGAGIELSGKAKQESNSLAHVGLKVGQNIYYNTYTGFGLENSCNVEISASDKAKLPLNFNIGVNSGPNGLDVVPSVSFNSELTSSLCIVLKKVYRFLVNPEIRLQI